MTRSFSGPLAVRVYERACEFARDTGFVVVYQGVHKRPMREDRHTYSVMPRERAERFGHQVQYDPMAKKITIPENVRVTFPYIGGRVADGEATVFSCKCVISPEAAAQLAKVRVDIETYAWEPERPAEEETFTIVVDDVSWPRVYFPSQTRFPGDDGGMPPRDEYGLSFDPEYLPSHIRPHVLTNRSYGNIEGGGVTAKSRRRIEVGTKLFPRPTTHELLGAHLDGRKLPTCKPRENCPEGLARLGQELIGAETRNVSRDSVLVKRELELTITARRADTTPLYSKYRMGSGRVTADTLFLTLDKVTVVYRD